MKSGEVSTLGEMLQRRARQMPDKVAYTYLGDGEREQARLTYRELDRRARAVASVIRSRDAGGLRVLLLFAPGVDFVAALFGCFYAGAVAVPAYPPDPLRIERTLPRLTAIVKDSSPALVLTTAVLEQMASPVLAATPELSALEWIAVDALPAGATGDAHVEPDDLAFIQYTSGSTATPKGVMVSHENALANLRMSKERTGQGESRVIACWVPFYHDLGLLCGMLLPAFIGGSVVFMSPLDFFQRPARWFEAIQRYRVTDTCAPNFALDICASRIRPEQRRSFDLSSLKVLVISAEPVRPSSLRRFLEAFAPAGLSPTCLIPAYGLAEAVLGLTCAAPGRSPAVAHIDADALQENRWCEVPPDHPRGRALIRCGAPMPGVRIEIVHPEQHTRCGPGEIGEIWALGPTVALGYWNRAADTREVFGAELADSDEGPFLRTGDLGYLQDGELYVTGRIKDLIIIRGRNHYPQDIEATVERSHPAVRAGCVIAFSIDRAGVEQLVVVAEIDRSRLGGGPDEAVALEEVAQAIRLSVSAEHGVQVHEVALIKLRTIDKTSSGKLARRACRQRYLEARLDLELSSRSSAPLNTGELQALSSRGSSAGEPQSVGPAFAERLEQAAPERRRELLEAYVKQQIVKTLGPDAERAVRDGSTIALDSLAVLELTGRVDKDLGVKLPIARLHEGVSVSWLVEHLLENRTDEPWDARWRPAAAGQPRGQLLVPLQPALVRRPFFCISGTLGVALHLGNLARALGRDQPFYALQAPGIDVQERPLRTVEALAERYVEEIRRLQPRGPYVIGGYSFGGLVAYEMAQRLAALHEQVVRVLLLDTVAVAPDDRPPVQVSPGVEAFELLHVLRGSRGAARSEQDVTAEGIVRMSAAERQDLLLRELAETGIAAQGSLLARILDVHGASMEAMRRYRPRLYHGPVTLIRAEGGLPDDIVHPSRALRMQSHDPLLGWEKLCPDLRVVRVGGDHLTMATSPHVLELGAAVRNELDGSGHMEIDLLAHAARGAEPRRDGSVPPRAAPISVAPSVARPSVAPSVAPPSVAPSVAPPSAAPSVEAATLFNPFHPDFIEDPYPMLHRLRAEEPVHWSAMSLWCVSRYRDVVAGLRDKRFSADSRQRTDQASRRSQDGSGGRISVSAMGGWNRDEDNPQSRLYNNIMVTLDPPRHTRLRRLVSPVFEPGSMKRWRGYVQEIVDGLLAEGSSRGEFDVIRDVALPLPSMLICSLLGLPLEDVSMLQKWSFALSQALDPLITRDVLDRAGRAAEEFEAYLRRHVEEMRGAPKGELLGLMLAAEAEGDRLSTVELIASCIFFFMAGFESTTGVIGNSVLALLRNPEQMQLLREQPELIDTAVEELLRYDGSIRHVLRTATEDVDMGGKLIRSGDTVLFLLPAANRDPEEFRDPDRLDLTRKGRQHVAFGHGIHYCLGAPLTRLEVQVAVQSLIRTMPGMKLVPGGLRWRKSISLRALESLMVTPA